MKSLLSSVKDLEDPTAMMTFGSLVLFLDSYFWFSAGVGVQQIGILGSQLLGLGVVAIFVFRLCAALFLPFCHRIVVESGMGSITRMFDDGLSPMSVARCGATHALLGLGASTPRQTHRLFALLTLALVNYYYFPKEGLVAQVAAWVEQLPGVVQLPISILLTLMGFAALWPTDDHE